VCREGAGKISQTPVGVGQGGFKFCGHRVVADKKFQSEQDSHVYSIMM